MSSLDSLLHSLKSDLTDLEIQPFDFDTEAQNQLLFFIKPEVFMLEEGACSETCRFIWSRLDAFGIEVAGAYLMSAQQLEARQIMDRHYGFINVMSRTASTTLSQAERDSIQSMCGVSSETEILGGHEILARFPQFSAKSLDDLWATKKSKRLRSGLYIELFTIGGDELIIINGFHPYQLEHFTGSGRKICLLLLNSDLPWKSLRSEMLGDTFPEKATEGSIRGHLNRNASSFGFSGVTIANNCAHMSAGPFEAAFEFQNFLAATLPGFDLSQTRMGCLFKNLEMNPVALKVAIENPASQNLEIRKSLFDATEEGDALSAAAMYKHFYHAYSSS